MSVLIDDIVKFACQSYKLNLYLFMTDMPKSVKIWQLISGKRKEILLAHSRDVADFPG